MNREGNEDSDGRDKEAYGHGDVYVHENINVY